MTTKPPITVVIAEDDEIEKNQEAVNELVRLLGYDPEAVLVTNDSSFLDFLNPFDYPNIARVQAKLREILPVEVPGDTTLVQAVYIIQQSIPGWPNSVKPN